MPSNADGTAVFFQLFNFKMKTFPIFGHLQYISDRNWEKFYFEIKQLKKYCSTDRRDG